MADTVISRYDLDITRVLNAPRALVFRAPTAGLHQSALRG